MHASTPTEPTTDLTDTEDQEQISQNSRERLYSAILPRHGGGAVYGSHPK